MPIYEYTCKNKKCENKSFSLIMGMMDNRDNVSCPSCKSPDVARHFGLPALRGLPTVSGAPNPKPYNK